MAAAIGVSAVLLTLAVWAAMADDRPFYDEESVSLAALSTIGKLLSLFALVVVGRIRRSRSMYLLAGLVAALLVGSSAIKSDWFGDILWGIINVIADIVPVSAGMLELAAMFLGLAVVAGVLVWLAYSNARADERSVVVTLIGILFGVGIFVGPVNALSTQGWSREWLLAEDLGQAVTLAVLAGYSVGLMISSRLRATPE